MLLEIADALTAAGAKADKRAVGKLSGLGAHLALPIAALTGFGVGVAEGAGQEFFSSTFGEKQAIIECAQQVVDQDKSISILIRTPVPSRGTQPKAAERPTTSAARRNIRVHELSKELGMTDRELMDLIKLMGVEAKSKSSTVIPAQADRIRRRAHRDGLVRDKQPSTAGVSASQVSVKGEKPRGR